MDPSEAVSVDVITVGLRPVTLEQVVRIASGRARIEVSEDSSYRERLKRGVARLVEQVNGGRRIYGVTTGFGDSCGTDVLAEEGRALALNLTRYHRCGTGRPFDEVETAAILVARLVSLARGYSAVRVDVLEQLARFASRRVLPKIPSEGSVGASGDLTPLAYVAAALAGEGEVRFEGRSCPAAAALEAIGAPPLKLEPKEALALVNGTSAMTGLAILAHDRAQYLSRLGAALTAMAVEALAGERGHFDARIFELKPHPGQARFARWVRGDLGGEPRRPASTARLQDRYSLRCAPHVVGVLLDVLPHAGAFLETELNSVNDNPIVDPDSGDVLLSGNFYGGHVCHAMDSIKACVASVADLFDRQLALLVNPVTSNGLPNNLVAVEGRSAATHHGFKAMQITASALTAEALKLTMPASAFSRSTENHNQDKVSLGTIAARDCLRIIELAETVAVVHLLALCQAVELRGRGAMGPRTAALHAAVREVAAQNVGDRAMDRDIVAVLERYRARRLPIGVFDP